MSRKEQNGMFFKMGGKPYWGEPPSGYLPSSAVPKPVKKQTPKQVTAPKPPVRKPRHLHLIDGDNNFKEATQRLYLADETDDVRIYVSQKGLYDKLNNKKRPHVTVIYVPPGDQAVDNQIKAFLGNAVKNGDYDDWFVISQDKGYDDMLQKYRSKYGMRKNRLDRRDMF